MKNHIALFHNGVVQVFRVRERYRTTEEGANAIGKREVVIAKPAKKLEFPLPCIRETIFAPVVAAYLEKVQNEPHPASEGSPPENATNDVVIDPEEIGKLLEGEWKLRRPSDHVSAGDDFSNLPIEGDGSNSQHQEGAGGGVSVEQAPHLGKYRLHDHNHPLSHAEIQTLAPFVPFSGDAKVSMFKYSVMEHHSSFHGSQHQHQGEDPNFANQPDVAWAFGNEIPGNKILVRKDRAFLTGGGLDSEDLDGMGGEVEDEEFELLDGEFEVEGEMGPEGGG